MTTKTRVLIIAVLAISCFSHVHAANVTITFDASVTLDFSSGPCSGLNPVGDMVTGYITYDDSVADSDPSFNEGHFIDSIVNFSFNVGGQMGSVDGADFGISTVDSDTLGGNDEKILAVLLNPSTMRVPAGPNIELTALFFQLYNSTNTVFTDPDSLSGISGIFDEFDQTNDSRFQVVGQCEDPNQPGSTGVYGFEAEVQRVSFVPEPVISRLFMSGLACLLFLRRRRV